MSGQSDDGGPAFPGQPWPDKFGVYEKSPGMTLRDWFAGQALAGYRYDEIATAQGVAEWVYLMADAMLAERKRGAAQ